MEPLRLECTMMPVTRYKDGAVGIKFVTLKEVGPEDFAAIDAYRQTNGWMLFRPDKFNESDIPTEDTDQDTDSKRTLADRQLKSLYKLHMLRGGSSSTFHSFYRQQMEVFLSAISDKIEAEENKK